MSYLTTIDGVAVAMRSTPGSSHTEVTVEGYAAFMVAEGTSPSATLPEPLLSNVLAEVKEYKDTRAAQFALWRQ